MKLPKEKNSGKYDIELNSFFISCDQNDVRLNENLCESKNSDLDYHCPKFLHCDEKLQEEFDMSELDKNAFKQTDEVRIVDPLFWHENNSHLLSQNFNQSKKVLFGIENKVLKNPGSLKIIDEVLSQSEGIIKTTHEVVEFEQRAESLNNRCFSNSRPKRKAAAASSSRNRVLAARNLI